MNNNISKAQIEVWDWKEKASEELSKVNSKDLFKFIEEKVSETKRKIIENQKLNLYNSDDSISFVADK